jgi:hypothetical protein
MQGKNKDLCAENTYVHELNEHSIVAYYRYRTQQASIAQNQQQEFERIDKLLLTKKGLRSGFHFLVNGPVWNDPLTKKRLFPHTLICALRGVDLTNYPSWTYIKEMQTILPELRVSWWDHQKGLCRVILSDGVSKEMKKRFVADPDQRRVFAESLALCSEAKARKADAEICAKLATGKSAYPELDVMRQYLHTLPFSLFLNFRRENGKETLKAARAYDQCHDQSYQERTVQAMWDEVRPHYPVSSTNNPLLARICAPNFSNVQGDLRRRWFAGCVEYDFQNLHFAVIARLYPQIMRETTSWLASGNSIWESIIATMGIAAHQKADAKELIKPRTYAIEYGMTPAYSEKELRKELIAAGIIFSADILACIQVQELGQATQQCLMDIQAKCGMPGPYGWVIWNRIMKPESFMSNVIQSYEVALRFPLYQLAINQKENRNSCFDIIHDQHDGVATLYRPGKEQAAHKQIMSVCQRAIDTIELKTNLFTKNTPTPDPGTPGYIHRVVHSTI